MVKYLRNVANLTLMILARITAMVMRVNVTIKQLATLKTLS